MNWSTQFRRSLFIILGIGIVSLRCSPFEWLAGQTGLMHSKKVYELVQDPNQPFDPSCPYPQKCAAFLNLTKRVNGKAEEAFYGVTCCWQCVGGKNLCAARFWPGKVLEHDGKRMPERERCSTVQPTDFVGDGRQALECYLNHIAQAYGGPYGITPDNIKLFISEATPPSDGNGHTKSGEVACYSGAAASAFGAPRQITLYRLAFSGSPYITVYNTIAHEFWHHVQVVRDGLPNCGIGATNMAALENEANSWASGITPPCP